VGWRSCFSGCLRMYPVSYSCLCRIQGRPPVGARFLGPEGWPDARHGFIGGKYILIVGLVLFGAGMGWAALIAAPTRQRNRRHRHRQAAGSHDPAARISCRIVPCGGKVALSGVCSRPVRQAVGFLPCLRRVGSLLSSHHRGRSDARPWAVRVVVAWAVLAGLFFMHGAASAADCQDGPPRTSVVSAAAPVLPTAEPYRDVTGMVRVTAAGHLAASVPSSSRVTAAGHGSCCGSGLCSSRQPRQGSDGVSAAGGAAALLPYAFMAGLGVRFPAAGARRARPPGRPGLPLPLFLGVSRT